MNRIDRYIFKTVASTALIGILVLLVLETFLELLAQMEDVGRGNYDIPIMIEYLLLTLPRRTYETFPMALLLGGLLGMGTLANGSELIVMRAAGLSKLRLVGAALKAGFILSLLALVLGEFIAPYTEQKAQELRSNAIAEAITIRGGKGFWAKDGNRFISVQAMMPGIRLVDIHVYEVDKNANLILMGYAQGARYSRGHWILDGVSRSTIRPDRVITEHLISTAVDSVISPAMLKVLAADPQDLSIRDLLIYIDYLQTNGLDTKPYQLAFWTKVIAPFSNLAMLFIAMPFVFGSQRIAGTGQRLTIGVLLGLLFYLGNRMVGNVVLLYGYPPFLGAALPTLLFFAAGMYALHRIR